MPTITITSESFATIGALVQGDAPATLTLNLGTPGPAGPQGPVGSGAEWGDIVGTIAAQIDLQSILDSKLPKAGGYMTGDIQSSNDSAYRSWDGAYNTAVLKGSYLQLTNSNTGGNSLTMEWNGITFPSGKQTVHYPGTSILSGYATESWVTGQNYITSSALNPYALIPSVQNSGSTYNNAQFTTSHYTKELFFVISGVTYAIPARIVS